MAVVWMSRGLPNVNKRLPGGKRYGMLLEVSRSLVKSI